MAILRNTTKPFLIVFFIFLVSACGGNNDPNYEGAQLSPPRVDGELAFSSPSLMKMAESFRVAGDYTSAVRLYQRAATENPKHIESRVALGQVYERLGAMDGAAIYYQQALDLDKNNMDANLGLGQILVKQNRPEEAIKYLEDIAAKSPTNYRIYSSIGLAYDLQGMHEQAQLSYGKGLSIKPDHISLLNNLALSFAIDEEYPPAIQLLSKALNLDYSQTIAQQNLIMVYALSGEEEAARTMAKNILTPEEIELKMVHYRWLKSLSSKNRAQAIFLDLKSFPNENNISKSSDLPITLGAAEKIPSEETDPKKRLLNNILNDENNIPDTDLEDSAKEVSVPVENNLPSEEADLDQGQPAFDAEFYHVQLGSHVSAEAAMSDWQRLQKRASSLLTNEDVEFKKIVTAENEERHRIFVGNYDNYNAANEFCEDLKNNNISCLVLKMTNPSPLK
jgi:Flp pilus assembly protein TadD